MSRILATLALGLLPLAAQAVVAEPPLQTVVLDFESNWGDLAPNTFVQINSLAQSPGGLRWGNAWFGQTTVPQQGSNNELRLGAGSFTVDNNGQGFYLDSVDFRKLQNGGNIRFIMVATTMAGVTTNFDMRVVGAPDVVLPPLAFTTFTGTAALGPLRSFSFGAFSGDEFGSDRNLFVMDNLHLRVEVAASPVPEPEVASMMGLGLGIVALAARRRRSAAKA
ncbi:exported hypothetical protein [Rubrivivax sp. A210]|uniref:PEP-CTERM sorting domain-containing protein n=1 Tax=Rubrivivax sp. A210 TaxID=2772301 RepID=UPI00191A89FE|nr:PEP-CTERM sorting domain-containing protein [Rubrivivax sp. A210]CAD5373328.1 exported hypothetical protein [Rubrivivax sp. A210]